MAVATLLGVKGAGARAVALEGFLPGAPARPAEPPHSTSTRWARTPPLLRAQPLPSTTAALRSLPWVSRNSALEGRLSHQPHASQRSRDPGKDFSTSRAWATCRKVQPV